MDQSRSVFIYGLIDPRNDCLRYIGKADVVATRVRQHIARARHEVSHKSSWIRGVLSSGFCPRVVVLAQIARFHWKDYEKLLIQSALQKGFNLTNSKPGGEGDPELSRESIERGNVKRRLTASTPEHKALMSAVLKEALSKPEVKVRMSLAFKAERSKPGRKEAMARAAKLGWEKIDREQIKEIRSDYWRDESVRQRHSKAYRDAWASPEGKALRSAMS